MLTLEELAGLWQAHRPASQMAVREFSLGSKRFAFNRSPAIIGVINLSPDSWYRESVCLSQDQAVQRGQVLAAQGADLIDLGAESSLAHAQRADESQQKSKLLPVLRGLRESGILVSVETYELGVARAALEAGANVVNLTGNAHTAEICRMAADHGAAVILCYVQGRDVRSAGEFTFAPDPVGAMHEYFARAIEIATDAGLEKIVIDPGLGFYYRNLQDSAVRVRFQMQVFLNTFRLHSLGVPICHALPHAFEFFGAEVRTAESFFAVLAALGKTHLFRTHEVPRVKAVLDTMKIYECGGGDYEYDYDYEHD